MIRDTRYLWMRLLGILLLTALAVAAAILQSTRLTLAQARQQLAQVAPVTLDLRKAQLDQLQLRSEALAKDPAFVDYMVQSLQPSPLNAGGGVDRASISDLLHERRQGFDILMVLDAKGRPAARQGVMLRPDEAISQDPLITGALRSGQPTRGSWVYDGSLLWITVNPLVRSGLTQGLLLSAQRAGPAFVATINRYTGVNAALMVSAGRASGFVIAGSQDLPPWAAQALPEVANELPAGAQLPGQGVATTVMGGNRRVPALLVPLPSSSGRAMVVGVTPNRHGFSSLVFMLVLIALASLLAQALTFWTWRRHVQPLQQLALDVELTAQGVAFAETGAGDRTVRRLRRGIGVMQPRGRREAPESRGDG